MEDTVTSLIDERARFVKTNMELNGLLKSEQTKKYVMYYIFFKEEPIYVGITNSFNRRKSEHFSKKYREGQSDKRLYEHMSKHDMGSYAMHIVLEANDSKGIEDFEISHISNLRSLKFDIKNTSSGGGYSTSANRMIVDNVKRFVSMFEEIESLTIKLCDDMYFDIDFTKLERYIKKLDWELLRSITAYSTINRTIAYDDYLRKNVKKEDIEFEDYAYRKSLYTIPDTLNVAMFFDEVYSGKLVSDTGKASVVNRFMDLVDQLELNKNPLEVFVAIKLLMGYDYQDDILPIINENDSWSHYDLEDYIKGYGNEVEEDYWYYKGELDDED